MATRNCENDAPLIADKIQTDCSALLMQNEAPSQNLGRIFEEICP